MQYLFLLLGNNGYANAPQCYVYTYIACLVWHCPSICLQYMGKTAKTSFNIAGVRALNSSKHKVSKVPAQPNTLLQQQNGTPITVGPKVVGGSCSLRTLHSSHYEISTERYARRRATQAASIARAALRLA